MDVARRHASSETIEVRRNGAVVARLAYVVRRSWIGQRWGAAPDWSHLCGPMLSPHLTATEAADALREMLAGLSRRVSYGFTCGPNSPHADLVHQAFLSAGFDHFVENTCSQPASAPETLARMSRKHRSRLVSAGKKLVITEIDGARFTEFYAANLDHVGTRCRTPLTTARALIAAGLHRAPAQVRVTGIGTAGEPSLLDAAIACTWDDTRYYYWMSTRFRGCRDRDLLPPHPDAIKLLLLDAIAHSRRLRLRFDADGLATPGSDILHRTVLKLPDMEQRDVFVRRTWQMRAYAAARRASGRSP